MRSKGATGSLAGKEAGIKINQSNNAINGCLLPRPGPIDAIAIVDQLLPDVAGAI
jgi:hypothetical protein